jgi:hypothetical protein
METVEPTVDPKFSLRGFPTEVERLRSEVDSLATLVHTISNMNHSTYKDLKKLRMQLMKLGFDVHD